MKRITLIIFSAIQILVLNDLFGQILMPVDFVGIPSIGDAPLTVKFTTDIGNIPLAAIQMVIYDYGDGATSYYELHPTHTYRIPGIYTVSLHIHAPPNFEGKNIKENYITVSGVPMVETPTFNPLPGTYNSFINVTINCTTPGMAIHYTIDESDPTDSDPLYVNPIQISSSTTLKARAYKSSWQNSEIAIGYYNIKVTTPTFSPLPGDYNNPIDVTIRCTTQEAAIHYTLDGSDPTNSDSVYTNPIHISSKTTLRARAYRSGFDPSSIKTGYYSFINKWNALLGGAVTSSPAIGQDGTIYVGSYDNKLYAFTSAGAVKWAFATGYRVESSPAIGQDGTIYVGSMDDKFYAINPDGTEKWVFKTDRDIESSPAIGQDGTIYVGSWDNRFYAINPDGTEKWTYTTGHLVNSSPAIGRDGTIYVGSSDKKLYAFYSESAGLSSSPWPKFRQNNQNTGLIGDSKPSDQRDEKIYESVPRVFELKHNYPNPFNPITTIEYQLPKTTEVSLKIYNPFGRLVKTLVHEKQVAGNYYVTLILATVKRRLIGRRDRYALDSTSLYFDAFSLCRILMGRGVPMSCIIGLLSWPDTFCHAQHGDIYPYGISNICGLLHDNKVSARSIDSVSEFY